MKKRMQLWAFLLVILTLCPFALSQQKGTTAQSLSDDVQEKNIQEYIELIRTNVRQEKAQILGSVMQLDATEAAKFWPIYAEYDTALSKLNKLRSDNIQDYAKNYDTMSDDKADVLIKKAFEYQKQRSDLLATYYDRFKQSIGAVNAARFLQVENQLLLIIDLQIHSNLPLVEQGSEVAKGDNQ
jgi:hypothetical protein